MSCDMCGKKTCNLEPLLDQYKTDDIQNVCYECSRILTKHLWRIRRVTDGYVRTVIKEYMANFKANKEK